MNPLKLTDIEHAIGSYKAKVGRDPRTVLLGYSCWPHVCLEMADRFDPGFCVIDPKTFPNGGELIYKGIRFIAVHDRPEQNLLRLL